jgi:hypothetical protein
MIACDLFAALTIADWPKREWTVLAEVLLQQYGPRKLKEVHLNPLEIEHYSGLNSKNVYRAIRNLKACNVIRETASGAVTFVKDYEEWLIEEVERVTGTARFVSRLRDLELRYPLSANARHGIQEPTKKASKGGIPSGTDPKANSTTVGVPLDTNNSLPVGVPLDTESTKNGVPLDTKSITECPVGHPKPAETVSRWTPIDTDKNHIEDDVNPEIANTFDNSVARDRRRAPGDLENLENSPLSPNVRDPDDLALVREAMQILASHPNSGHLAERVGREHNTPDNVRLAGWKWVVAASKAFERSEGDGKPIDWPYLRGIVRNARRAEYDKIRAESAPDSDPATPAANRPLARKPTPAERRKADSEAIRLAVSQLDPDEES